MKTLAIGDSYPAHPRLKKISRYFTKEETDFALWNRDNHTRKAKENEWVFECTSGYGHKVQKLKKLFQFRSFIKQTIEQNKYERIICRQWQTFFLVYTLRLNTTVEIIYDVCDMPSNPAIRWLESHLRKKADQIVLASRFFGPYYQAEQKRLIILENRPMKSPVTTPVSTKQPIVSPIRLTFLGRIRYGELLKQLIDVVRKEEMLFFIHGSGPDEQMLKDYVFIQQIRNVIFCGAYEEKQIAAIYEQSDVIWAAYDDRLFNVKRAISNKFFETLVYKKPGIFSKETDLGQMIEETQIGLVVNPHNGESVRECLEKIQDIQNIRNCQEQLESWPEPLYFDTYLEESPYRT